MSEYSFNAEEKRDRIVQNLKEYAKISGFTDVVLGISIFFRCSPN